VLRDNLRRIQNEPALLVIEIAWRWLFGAAAFALLTFAFVRLQHAVVINSEEEELLSSMSPTLMAQAMVTILARALPVAARLAALIIPALLVLWIVAASVGRATVITRLLGPQSNLRWSGFIGVHIVRAASVLALSLAYIGCAFIAGFFAGPDPNMFMVTLIFLLFFGIAVFVWMWVHWVLSLAAIFPVREGATTWSAVRSALRLVRQDGKQLAAVAATNGSARTLLALIFTFFGLVPLVLYRVSPGLFIAIELAIFLVYCLLSDWMLLGRLVGYLEVANSKLSPSPEA